MANQIEKQSKNVNRIKLQPTDMDHVFLCDWYDDGTLHEIAVVAEFPDGTICAILIGTLHTIDKARLKKVITSQHAKMYPLWELLSQARLSNGCNALDYFHTNFVKQKRPKGAKISQESLSSVNIRISDKVIGSEFANPAEINLDQNSKQFI